MAISDQIVRLTSLRNDFRSKFIDLGLLSSASVSATFSDCYSVLSSVSGLSASSYTPSNLSQIIPAGTYLNGSQTIEAIPSAYIIPSGTITINKSGTFDVTSYASANVAGGGGPSDPYVVYKSYYNAGSIFRFATTFNCNFKSDAFASYMFNGELLLSGALEDNFSIINGENVTSLPDGAFMSAGIYLATAGSFTGYIDIPSMLPNLEIIGQSAFLGNYNIRKIFSSCALTFSKVKTIKHYAFASQSMNAVSFPAMESFTAGYGFASCSSIQSAYFENLKYIDDATGLFYYCTLLKTVSMPMLERISTAANMFCYCRSLSYVEFPNLKSITSAASSMFQSCSALVTVSMPMFSFSSSRFYANYMFYNCGSLQTFDIRSIAISGSIFATGMFANCYKLSYVNLGSVSTLNGSRIFSSCRNLISLYFSSYTALTSAISTMFNSTPMYDYSTSAGRWGSIYVPASLVDTYKTATNWTVISSRFTSII